MKTLAELREELASIEHERWSAWQKHLHSKCVEDSNGDGEWVCFPAEDFRRWERQIATPYSELSHSEQESDREQVDRYFGLVFRYYKEMYGLGRQWKSWQCRLMNKFDFRIWFCECHYQAPYGRVVMGGCRKHD